ncbi:hypothetical protein Prudu_015421 [Prunus dulcis]|uniref:Uncharacterized protein n=1 Tax=Prunus dulcis TaxID=3755 RepID=A0A4Y1RJ05_PRUDU|nr:hypothetical protein Prudu_015421 [Prunus dulcis]
MHKHRQSIIVFLSSSSSSLNAKDRSFSSCFHRTQKISGSKKLGIVAPQDKSSKEMNFEEDEKARQQSLMIQRLVEYEHNARVVKRKLQKVRPIVEYNKMGKVVHWCLGSLQSSPCGQEMVQIPKDVKEQIWEAVDMAFVVGQGGKKSVLASAARNEGFQIREKLEYNHRLSRKGYAGLEDELEETMPGVEIDRSSLWKRARQDKHGNIPIQRWQKSKINCKPAHSNNLGRQSQSRWQQGCADHGLGPEHPGRLRGVGAGISPRQYFNLPKPQRALLPLLTFFEVPASIDNLAFLIFSEAPPSGFLVRCSGRAKALRRCMKYDVLNLEDEDDTVALFACKKSREWKQEFDIKVNVFVTISAGLEALFDNQKRFLDKHVASEALKDCKLPKFLY